MGYMCPVCGYPDLIEEPRRGGDYSYEICNSCGFEFGVSDLDLGYSYEQWRQKWIAEGMIWDEGNSKPPTNWNPKLQLLTIGINV